MHIRSSMNENGISKRSFPFPMKTAIYPNYPTTWTCEAGRTLYENKTVAFNESQARSKNALVWWVEVPFAAMEQHFFLLVGNLKFS